MLLHKLPPATMWRAIESYLAVAYTSPLPSAIRSRLETLRSLPDEDFYASPIFERDPQPCPNKLSLRLGNQFYPHMKLSVERSPDRAKYLFRADAHDTHICPPPGSREHAAFKKLMEQNKSIVQAIESRWAELDVPTFKTYLRDDLARRSQTTTPPRVG